MGEKEGDVTVKIPKAMAKFIQKQEWFKLYADLDDFIVSAAREKMEKWRGW